MPTAGICSPLEGILRRAGAVVAARAVLGEAGRKAQLASDPAPASRRLLSKDLGLIRSSVIAEEMGWFSPAGNACPSSLHGAGP